MPEVTPEDMERARRWLERYGADIDRAAPPESMVAWLAAELAAVREKRTAEVERIVRKEQETWRVATPAWMALDTILRRLRETKP